MRVRVASLSLTLCYLGMVQWESFILRYVIELGKCYRMVFESWELVEVNQLLPTFTRSTICECLRVACKETATAEVVSISRQCTVESG